MMTLSDEEQKAIFSFNLQKQICLKGKEQKAICADLGINPPTFNQWVKGKAIPRVSELRILACYFGIALSDLVDPPNTMKQFVVSKEEKEIILAYREVSSERKNMVCEILHINPKTQQVNENAV